MRLSQLIRDHFDQITEWRSARVTWPEIESRIRKMGVNPGTGSVQHLYYRECARRQSPEWVSAFKWASDNYNSITEMLGLGYSWSGIFTLVPPKGGIPSPSRINMFIEEFKAIERLRSVAAQPASNISAPPLPDPAPASSHAASPAPDAKPPRKSAKIWGTAPGTETENGIGRPRTMREQAQAAVPATSEFATIDQDRGQRKRDTQSSRAPVRQAADPAPDDPPPRRPRSRVMAKVVAQQQEQSRQAAAEQAEKDRLRAEKLAYRPNSDPYLRGADLRSKIERVNQEIAALVTETYGAQPEKQREIQSQIDALNTERSRLNDDFFTRHCHSKATRAVLATLSAAALSSGAFRIADESETVSILGHERSAISLAGYDRPEQIAGVSEIPDPLYVIESFTPDDLTRLQGAYQADRAECPIFDHSAATPRRRLAEAVVLRGAYVWRSEGWCAYDDYTQLKGVDHPSPSLLINSTLVATAVDHYLDAIDRNCAPSVNLAPKLTGTEPDWSRIEPWNRSKLKASTGGWLDNDRGYGS